MLGWILAHEGLDPTIMNGAVMKNFRTPDAPFASARVGGGGVFVSEVDESDGSIALYRPQVAVLNNVSLDHKSLEELRELFGDFVRRSGSTAANFDDPEVVELVKGCADLVSFAVSNQDADLHIVPNSIVEMPTGISALIAGQGYGTTVPPLAISLKTPGRHNLSNAMAAIAAAYICSVDPEASVAALATFTGLARRFDIVGTSPAGVTVIDDFGHNPEKVAATLATLKAHPGRVIAFFQPHGYGPLRQMGHELAEVLATRLGPDDLTILCDPVYFGGTVDRSEGSQRIVRLIGEAGGQAEYIPDRAACGDRIVAIARPGDRIVVMGARDDTLSGFAADILCRLA